MSATVAALVGDLMFLSRIREAARGRGLEVRAVRGAAELLEVAGDAVLVIVDLDEPRLGGAEAVAALRREPATQSLPVIGFFSHVHADRGREGRLAGCTRAMPRSAFVEQLSEILNEARSGS